MGFRFPIIVSMVCSDKWSPTSWVLVELFTDLSDMLDATQSICPPRNLGIKTAKAAIAYFKSTSTHLEVFTVKQAKAYKPVGANGDSIKFHIDQSLPVREKLGLI